MSYTRNKKSVSGEQAAAIAVITVVRIVLRSIINSLFVLIGWNAGIVGAAAALHAHVQTIGFWTALGISFALSLIGRAVSGSTGVQASTDKS